MSKRNPQPPDWHLDGPDAEGKLWFFKDDMSEGECLGDSAVVMEYLADWLAAQDYGE